MTTQFGSAGGFLVTDIRTIMGKKDGDRGRIRIVLEAAKEDVTTGEHDYNDISAALNVHQEAKYPVTLRLAMSTDRE